MRHALLGLLLCLSAACAFAAELKVATWNLEWLTDRPDGDPTLPHDAHPKRSDDIARLAAYATKLDADLIAIQEVDGRDIAARIFPPDRYAIHMTHDHVMQRVGLVVRRGLEYDTNPDLTTLAVSDHGRSSLRSGADITLHLPGGAFRVLAVHLKALCERDPLTDSHRPACTVLRAQVPALQAWIAAREQERAAYVVLGDFNRWMDGNDQFLAALRKTGHWCAPPRAMTAPAGVVSISSITSWPAGPPRSGCSRQPCVCWCSRKPALTGRNACRTTARCRCASTCPTDGVGSAASWMPPRTLPPL